MANPNTGLDAPRNVRCRGQTGRDADMLECRFLTDSGHAANRTSAVVRAVPEFHRGMSANHFFRLRAGNPADCASV